MSELAKPNNASQGATAVITHRVHEDNQNDYERWIHHIYPACQRCLGHLDINIVRPIPDKTQTYTIIIRFDTTENLENWMNSPLRAGLITEVKDILMHGDEYSISSGLDFLFTQGQTKAPVPKRWKQYVLTLTAIYPMVLLLPVLLIPLLRQLGVPAFKPTDVLILVLIIVFLMVYVIMPRLTKLVRHWLFK